MDSLPVDIHVAVIPSGSVSVNSARHVIHDVTAVLKEHAEVWIYIKTVYTVPSNIISTELLRISLPGKGTFTLQL